MATLNLGRIKPVFRGAYNGATAYVVDDIVTDGGETFICILASQGNATSNATYWKKLAAKGTDGTDVGATLTTEGDILYRDGSGLQRLAKGTAGQFLKINAGATAPEWGAVSGGDVVKITHSANITNQSEISLEDVFTLGTYTYYKVVFEGIFCPTGEGQMRARWYSSGSTEYSGSNYISSGTETGRATAGNNYSSHRNHHDSYIEIQDNFTNNTSHPSHLVFEFFNPMKTGSRPTARYYHVAWSGTGWMEEKQMGVTYDTTGVVSGMKFWTNGYNTTCNSVKIYGFK